MRQGVFDSDVVCLFLTNSTLSRDFCLKEIKWAMEFGKPIVILVEEEARFFAWSPDRWRTNTCSRQPGGLTRISHNWPGQTVQ